MSGWAGSMLKLRRKLVSTNSNLHAFPSFTTETRKTKEAVFVRQPRGFIYIAEQSIQSFGL